MDKEVAGGQKHLVSSVEKFDSTADLNRKRKRPMQPFAISPSKPGVRAKNPLEASGSTRKMKTIQPTFRETKGSEYYFSDEESYDLEENSGVEVKGHSDYKEDWKLNSIFIFT